MPVTIPPFTNVPAPNDPVASAWAQQLTQFAVDQIVAQPDTPTNPDTELWYDTDDPGASFPNMPRGIVGSAQGSGTTSVGATATDVAGLAVTFTADPSRQYHAIVTLSVIQRTAPGLVSITLTTAPAGAFGTTMLASGIVNQQIPIANQLHIPNGLSGTHTVKVQASTAAGTCDVQSGAGQRSFLVVFDVGSAGQSGGGGAYAITPWTALPLINSWVNYGGGSQSAQYRKVGDEVQVRGTVKSGNFNGGIATLPVGFRPPALINAFALGAGGNTLAICDIQTDGNMLVYYSGTQSVGNQYLGLQLSFSTVAT